MHYNANVPASTTPNLNGNLGFLRVSDLAFQCMNDPNEPSYPRSFYGDVSDSWADLSAGPPATTGATDMGHWVWNYWGYKDGASQDGDGPP